MKKNFVALAALIFSAIGLVGWYLLVNGNNNIRFGWSKSEDLPNNSLNGILRIGYGYLITLIGVLLGSFYKKMQEMKAAGETSIKSVRDFFKSMVRDLNLWMALCASPIVYALVVKAADGLSIPSFTFIGLENGFFCLSIITAIAGQKANAQ
jgi:hypothetical protein